MLVYRELKRQYVAAAGRSPKGLCCRAAAVEEPIWIYWEQGLAQAPALVRSCVDSIRRHGGRSVIILAREDIQKYITFPAYIGQKRKAEKISVATYADMIRFSLLAEFGGTWIDATVFLSAGLPACIMQSEFFACQDTTGRIANPARISNWLLHCRSGNAIMREVRNMPFAYWKEENRVVEYLFTYFFLGMALERHPETEHRLPYVNSDHCYLMLRCLQEQYEEKSSGIYWSFSAYTS